MLYSELDRLDIEFRTAEDVQPFIQDACKANPEISSYHHLGESEEGRPIYAVSVGNGSNTVSLIAGAHSDEPVGPETLRTLILKVIQQKNKFSELLSNFCFIIIPHINPDGEARNQRWIKEWPSVESYLLHAFRELPGRDLEFGFPKMRKENELVSDFLTRHAPVSLHMSLHGMGFSDGVMLLIEKHWIDRTEKLRSQFSEFVRKLGLNLHDHDRKGEKGFQYIGPGYATTPEGRAMQAYFDSIGDHETAKLFRDSSMEFVRKLGGEPLCLVTELPLFLICKQVENQLPGVPAAYLAFKNRIQEMSTKLTKGESIRDIVEEFEIQPLDLCLQVKMHLWAIQLGLDCLCN